MDSKKSVGYFVINTHLGNYQGHSINICKTIEGMRVAGLDIRILAPRYDADLDLEQVFSDYTLAKSIPVVQLWVPGSRPSRLLFFYYTFAVWFWLLWQIVRRRCQFIYVRSEYLFPLAWLAKLTSTPLFYEIHRLGMTDRVQRVKAYLASKARGIVVLTAGLRDQFSTHNQTVHVEHDAVNFEHFAVSDDKTSHREVLGWPVASTIMVYTGSVQPIKGIDMIIDNADSFPDVQFYIIGRITAAMADAMRDLPPNVHALGDYTHDQLPAFLKAADLLLIPHPAGPQSQSPMKLFEYLATGRPVLSSDLPNIREVLPDSNLYFSAGDHESYQAAIRQFLAAPVQYESVRDANMAVAQEHTYTERGRRIAEFVQAGLSGLVSSK